MNTEPALSPPDDYFGYLVEAIAEERARDLMADATQLWEFVSDSDYGVDIWPELAAALTLITTPAANTANRDLATAKLKRIAELVLKALKQDQLAYAREEAALVQRKRQGPKQWDGGKE